MSKSAHKLVDLMFEYKTMAEIVAWLEQFLVNSLSPFYWDLGPFDPFIVINRDYTGGGDYLKDLLNEFEFGKQKIFGDACVIILEKQLKQKDLVENHTCLTETLLLAESLPVSKPDQFVNMTIELLCLLQKQELNDGANELVCRILLVLAGALNQCKKSQNHSSICSIIEPYIDICPAPVISCMLYLDEDRLFELLPVAVQRLEKISTSRLLLLSLRSRFQSNLTMLIRLEKLIESEGWQKYLSF